MYDNETELYYLSSRYYDPETGRFVNADGYAATGQGLLENNMFTYCLNNPVNYADRSGELAEALPWLIKGFIELVKGISVVLMAGTAVGAGALMGNEIVDAGAAIENPAVPMSAPASDILSPKATPSAEELEKEKVEALTGPTPPPSDDVTIYRYYASKTENLAPRKGIDYDGLSFSTKPPKHGA